MKKEEDFQKTIADIEAEELRAKYDPFYEDPHNKKVDNCVCIVVLVLLVGFCIICGRANNSPENKKWDNLVAKCEVGKCSKSEIINRCTRRFSGDETNSECLTKYLNLNKLLSESK